MAQNTVNTSIAPQKVRSELNGIAGQVLNSQEIQAVLTRAGMAILGRIKQAFVRKARGGTDDAGDRWAPLAPKTIAYGRRGRTQTEKKRSEHPSQALTKKQQDRWWGLYRQGLAIFKGNKTSAARRAWAIVKREGATTLFAKYSSRKVEILRDTGLLLNSLSPGMNTAESVFRVEEASVTIGTNRKGAAAHHHGVPGKLPQRRLWPDPAKWPATWWKDVTNQIRQGIIDVIVKRMQK